MFTDPSSLRVLCFGASNTYGTCLRNSDSHGTPTKDPDYVRLNADRRWTGVLQTLLGDGYDVIEEGLNGRTTDLDYEDRPGCNGRSYFVPCLLSHGPLDAVVVELGGNDLKPSFGRTPTAIAEALGGYVDDIAANVTDRQGGVPMTVLIGPTLIDDTARKSATWSASTSTLSCPPASRSSRQRSVAWRRSGECGTSTRRRWPIRATMGSTSAWTHTLGSRTSSPPRW